MDRGWVHGINITVDMVSGTSLARRCVFIVVRML
jgi:hypothetical protein